MIGIVTPLALIALPAILIMVLVIARRQIHHKILSAKLGISGSVSPLKATLLSTIPLFTMGIALLRPYAGTTEFTVPSATDDYMFVVDVSRSMYARDVPPSRIELAKRKLKDLIAENKRSGRPRRYGITLFAGYSYLLCPMTDDTSVLQQFISEISPEMVTSLGSNLEAGISTALARFDERTSPNARILLLSDGEDDVLEVDRVISLIKEKKIRVDVLGVGTTQGTTIQFDNGTLLKDSSGNVVQTRLEENSLKKIAAAASGVYVRATLEDSDITTLTRESLTTHTPTDSNSRVISSFNEFGSWFACAALVMIVLSAGVKPLRHIVRIALLVLIPFVSASATPQQSSSPDEQQTPQPSTSPEETSPSKDSPSPQTPNPNSSPTPPQESPPRSPSPEPNKTPDPQETRLKENQPEDALQAPPGGSPSAEPTLNAEAPSVPEAEAWLESLPDSPLLIRRERGRTKQGGQTW